MEKFALLTSVLSSEAEESLKKILENPYPRTEIQTFRGRKIIPDFNAATMEYIHNKWNAKSGDVFIASYPKTGFFISIISASNSICLFFFKRYVYAI